MPNTHSNSPKPNRSKNSAKHAKASPTKRSGRQPKMDEPKKPKNREVLRELRKRAHLSGTDCANALGLAGPTGYMRYETDNKYDDDKYSVDFIQKLIPIFVGRGFPAVTEQELLAITNMPSLPAFTNQTVAPSVTPLEAPTPRSTPPGKSDREMLAVLYGALQVTDTSQDPKLTEVIRLLEAHLWGSSQSLNKNGAH